MKYIGNKIVATVYNMAPTSINHCFFKNNPSPLNTIATNVQTKCGMTMVNVTAPLNPSLPSPLIAPPH